MSSRKTLEILHDIAECCLGSAIINDAAVGNQVHETGWEKKLNLALHEELAIEITAEEIRAAGSLLKLSELLESRLVRDPAGRSLVDIYSAVEKLAREELPHEINYHWYATWRDDLLNKTDSLEDIELVLRMEDTFGLSISDRDAHAMHTVGQNCSVSLAKNP